MADWSKQRYWEDVKIGEELTPVDCNVTLQRLVMEAGANRDFNAIHHNTEMSKRGGAPDMFMNNVFIQGMWERTAREYIGVDGVIKKVGPFRMRIFNIVGEKMTTKGKVTKKWQENGENFVEIELWSENPKGVSVGPGPYLVTLPAKGQKVNPSLTK